MKEGLPRWIYRALIGIVVIAVVSVYQAYKVLTSSIGAWDKTGIFFMQILCLGGLIYLFFLEYGKYRGNVPRGGNRVHIAIKIPLIVLGLVSAYLIVPPFLRSFAVENNSPSVLVAKIVAFATIAVIGISNIFYARK